MIEIKCDPDKHELDNYPGGASCVPCYMTAMDCYDDLLVAYMDLQKKLAALEQWQKEAVELMVANYLPQYKDLIKQAEEDGN